MFPSAFTVREAVIKSQTIDFTVITIDKSLMSLSYFRLLFLLTMIIKKPYLKTIEINNYINSTMVSAQLFELIHSLSPSEKGYIKKKALSSGKGEENFYIKLFDAVANQQVYDEDKIIKKFKGEIFIKNISKSKNHLYNLILKRLVHFHEENIVKIKIKGMLNQGFILYKKGLHQHALSHYERALKLSLENEELVIAHEIYSSMIAIYLSGNMGVKFPYENEMAELSKKIQKEQKISSLSNQITELMFSDNFNRDDEQIKKINDILTHPLLNEISSDDSFYTQWGKMCLFSHGYYLLGENKMAEEIKMKQLDFLRANKTITNKTPMRYVKHLVNVVNAKLIINDFEPIPALLEELKNYESEETLFEHIEPLKTSTYYIQYFTYLTKTNQIDKAYSLIEESSKWFEMNENSISDYFKILFYNCIFLVYFLKGEFRKCIPWLNKILFMKTSFRKEFRLSMKFQQLILHYELKNYELISYQIKAIYRDILKQNNDQEATKYILRWFQNFLKKINHSDSLTQSAMEIKSRLNKMTTEDEWKVLNEMNLFNAWIDSKISNEPMGDCYAAHFKKEITVE